VASTYRVVTNLSVEEPSLPLKPVWEWRADLCQVFRAEGTLQRYPRRAFVFLQGEIPTAAFSIETGRIEISGTSETGREVSHAIRHPGETFGFAELILREPRIRSARAMEDAEIWMLPRERFLTILAGQPDLVLALLGSTVHSAIRGREIQVNLSGASARRRVASMLELLAVRPGQDPDNPGTVTLRVTHQELSRLCDLTRQTVTAVLDELQSSGMLTLRSRTIAITDWPRLRRVIAGDNGLHDRCSS
jgi:CRP-like cAMP-binding protein